MKARDEKGSPCQGIWTGWRHQQRAFLMAKNKCSHFLFNRLLLIQSTINQSKDPSCRTRIESPSTTARSWSNMNSPQTSGLLSALLLRNTHLLVGYLLYNFAKLLLMDDIEYHTLNCALSIQLPLRRCHWEPQPSFMVRFLQHSMYRRGICIKH